MPALGQKASKCPSPTRNGDNRMKRAVAYPIILVFVAIVLVILFRAIGYFMSPATPDGQPPAIVSPIENQP